MQSCFLCLYSLLCQEHPLVLLTFWFYENSVIKGKLGFWASPNESTVSLAHVGQENREIGHRVHWFEILESSHSHLLSSEFDPWVLYATCARFSFPQHVLGFILLLVRSLKCPATLMSSKFQNNFGNKKLQNVKPKGLINSVNLKRTITFDMSIIIGSIIGCFEAIDVLMPGQLWKWLELSEEKLGHFEG